MKRIFSFMCTILLAVGCVACGQDISKDGAASSEMPSPPPSLTPTGLPEVSPAPEGKNILYQLIDTYQMMSYVIRTKNNRLIILDGGYDRNGTDLIQLAKTL